MRQEQRPASDEIIEVAPGVLRLQLPIDFTGLGHVNTYAIEDGEGFAVVDPGLPGKPNWEHLQVRMAAAGVPLRRVHTVLVTHSHPDHFGGAGLLADESGATLVTSDRFRTFFDDLETDLDSWDDTELADTTDADEDGTGADVPVPIGRLRFERPTPWGGMTEGPPPERRKEMLENWGEMMQWFRPPKPKLRLADGDPLVLAGREWFALLTPGHTDDHICLWDPTEGVLLSGDHVLPSITPHISGLIEGDPLELFISSLDRVAAIEGVSVVLPAHGDPFHDVAARVDEIKAHHDERLEKVKALSREAGWADVVELSHRLFAERSWGSMAESETYAHLEHLRLRGEADVRRDGAMLEYLVPSH